MLRPALMLAAACLVALPAGAGPVPLPCEAACQVDGHAFFGYEPPVLVARAGALVTWASADGLPHINQEGATGEPAGCLQSYYDDLTPATVAFSLQGGQLWAEEGGVARPCTTAAGVEGGAALAYVCVIHPVFMRGTIVVLA